MVEGRHWIVQFWLVHGLERGNAKDRVKGCAGFGRKPKRWTWDGAMDGMVNDFINLYILFDYRTTYERILFVVGLFLYCCVIITTRWLLAVSWVLVCLCGHIHAREASGKHLPLSGTPLRMEIDSLHQESLCLVSMTVECLQWAREQHPSIRKQVQ